MSIEYKSRVGSYTESVYAEIYYVKPLSDNMEISVSKRWFNSWFGSGITDKNFKKAHRWIAKTMDIIERGASND